MVASDLRAHAAAAGRADAEIVLRLDCATIVAGSVHANGSQSRSLRCASLLKPIYAWVTAHPQWGSLTTAMVTRSDNDATDELISYAGGLDALRERVRERAGLTLEPADTWGRFHVTAAQVADLYFALRLAVARGDDRAAQVLAQMGAVRNVQRLRLDELWVASHGPLLGMKLGWDLSDDETWLRTHVALVGNDRIDVILTAVDVHDELRLEWATQLAAGGPEAVLPLHWAVVGDALQDAITSNGTVTTPS